MTHWVRAESDPSVRDCTRKDHPKLPWRCGHKRLWIEAVCRNRNPSHFSHLLSCSQAVNSRGSAIEQRCALIGRVAFAEALERVPQRRIAAAQLVDREVRFEHAAIGAEALDRVLEISARGCHQVGGGWGLVWVV